MLRKYIGLVIAVILLLGGTASAQEDGYSGYQITNDPSGGLRLKIMTYKNATGMWLGVTLYPPGFKNAGKESVNQIYPIKQGRGTTEIVVEPAFKNGTFEAAIWSKQLTKEECLKTDEICQKLGYKMTGMSSYIWGHLYAP